MTFAQSDVSSLTTTLSHWEVAEYICAGLVTLACLGEFIAEFTGWFTAGVEERKKGLGKASTLLLIAALALELVCLVRTNQLSNTLVGSLSQVAGEAATKSKDST